MDYSLLTPEERKLRMVNLINYCRKVSKNFPKDEFNYNKFHLNLTDLTCEMRDLLPRKKEWKVTKIDLFGKYVNTYTNIMKFMKTEHAESIIREEAIKKLTEEYFNNIIELGELK